MSQRKFNSGDAVKVYVFSPVEKAFDYLVGKDWVEIGSVVDVPFGAGQRKGVVWGEGQHSDALKAIEARLDYPAMKPAMMEFVETMAGYTITPIGQILPMAYRAGEAPVPKSNALKVVENFYGKLTPKRAALYERLVAQKILPLEAVDASKGIIKALVEQGAAELVTLDAPTLTRATSAVELSQDQNRALQEIRAILVR